MYHVSHVSTAELCSKSVKRFDRETGAPVVKQFFHISKVKV